MSDQIRNALKKIEVKQATACVAGVYVGYQALKYVWWKYKNAQVRAKGDRARAERDAKMY
jgi:hypothetical protein